MPNTAMGLWASSHKNLWREGYWGGEVETVLLQLGMHLFIIIAYSEPKLVQ